MTITGFSEQDISKEELQGMFDSANFILHVPERSFITPPTKREKRLAYKLLKAANWIKRESEATGSALTGDALKRFNDEARTPTNGFANFVETDRVL